MQLPCVTAADLTSAGLQKVCRRAADNRLRHWCPGHEAGTTDLDLLIVLDALMREFLNELDSVGWMTLSTLVMVANYSNSNAEA
jgi:hypothetical protein